MFGSFIRIRHHARPIGHQHRIADAIQHIRLEFQSTTDQFLARAKRLFGPFTFGDLFDDRDVIGSFFPRLPSRRNSQVDPDSRGLGTC